MKQLRRMALWAVLIAIALLIILSIVGTCLATEKQSAAERAEEVFNSVPLVVYWIVLVGLLIAGFVLFKRLLRSPGLLAVHLGSGLILIGAMFGSDRGHELAKNLFGTKKIPSGYMRIYEGQTRNTVDNNLGQEIGTLPFSVKLKNFWTEYYEPDQPWVLLVRTLELKEDGKLTWVNKPIEWVKGKDVPVPGLDVQLRVLEYFESGRPTYAADAKPTLEITLGEGKKRIEPVEVGKEIVLEDPHLHLHMVRTFTNLQVRSTGETLLVVNKSGPPNNPALMIEMVGHDMPKKRFYVNENGPMHGKLPGNLKLSYLFAQPTGAVADLTSNLPAMEIRITHQEKSRDMWFLVRKNWNYTGLSLSELPGSAERERREDEGIYLVKQQGQIRDWKSDLVVLEEGRISEQKVIELNAPLHYGGYHFYQSGYGKDGGKQYTELSVTSDSGLLAVSIGFILLAGGAFWLFWLKPAWTYLIKGRDDAL